MLYSLNAVVRKRGGYKYYRKINIILFEVVLCSKYIMGNRDKLRMRLVQKAVQAETL